MAIIRKKKPKPKTKKPKPKQKTISTGKNVEKSESFCTASSNVKRYSLCGNMETLQKKSKHRIIIYDPSISLLGIYSKDMEAET